MECKQVTSYPDIFLQLTDIYYSVLLDNNSVVQNINFETQHVLPYQDLNITYDLRVEILPSDEEGELEVPSSCETISITTFMTDGKFF
jgi:hypothetical protein